ncbi:MAG: 50S ribosomal protein L17 [Kofleriaceae bacterium]|jgi:large subunit ribosomal protein L17|nr:50S ribosomal protein L17 [Kofleriaceae bacterium]MBP6836717.1 50S ribosomal protein L17 [Kofleriaceae bacterium]
MRHRNSGKRLGRNSSHRDAMWANMVTSLLLHGRIETTEVKAKEVRRFAEDIVRWGTSVQPLLAKGDKMTPTERAKVLHAKRQARRVVRTREAMARLFGEVATHFVGRNGGYTRVLKTRIRKGDAAPMALIELIDMVPAPTAAAAA